MWKYLHADSIAAPDHIQKITIDSLKLGWEFDKTKNVKVEIGDRFVRFFSTLDVKGALAIFTFPNGERLDWGILGHDC